MKCALGGGPRICHTYFACSEIVWKAERYQVLTVAVGRLVFASAVVALAWSQYDSPSRRFVR
jgi:hypothetical protein